MLSSVAKGSAKHHKKAALSIYWDLLRPFKNLLKTFLKSFQSFGGNDSKHC
jgi:hypothetical protein